MNARDDWIQTPHGRLFVRDWPGETLVPLILMHDSLGSVDLWRDFPQTLAGATGRRVIAYDRLGFGRSDPHPRLLDPLSFIPGEAAGDFAAVIDHLAISRFAVLGHSVGGGMGVGIAATYPTRCQALITIAAQSFAESQTLQGIRDTRAGFADPTQLDRLAKYHGDKAEWVLNAWTGTWLAPEFAAWSLDAVLARVRCPVLAIHGADDPYGSPAHPQRIAAQAGGPVDLRLMPGEGHFPHRSNPSAIAAWVADFLASATAPAPDGATTC